MGVGERIPILSLSLTELAIPDGSRGLAPRTLLVPCLVQVAAFLARRSLLNRTRTLSVSWAMVRCVVVSAVGLTDMSAQVEGVPGVAGW